MKYAWSGWFDGEGDCEPPEPGKRWLEIHRMEPDGTVGEEIAVIVHRGTPITDSSPACFWDDETREKKESYAYAIVQGLNYMG
jgi:hypothetical protein